MKHNHLIIKEYKSPCGRLVLGAWQGRLCMCDWTESRHHQANIKRLCRELDAIPMQGECDMLRMASAELDEYFRGNQSEFLSPLLLVGTEFQKQVWSAMCHVPFGNTLSYGKLALTIGKPFAVRAVASAVGANVLSIFIPCHRIVGANGSLTGYAGGLNAKRHLLSLEGIVSQY